MANEKQVEPLRTSEFGLASHRFQQFDATAKPELTREDLENPTLWQHVAPRINPGDEIRVRAEDDSWVALLHVTYSAGNQIRVKLVYSQVLEKVNPDDIEQQSSLYEVKQKGVKKWCIIQKDNGDIIEELIPTKLEALKQLDDLERALAA